MNKNKQALLKKLPAIMTVVAILLAVALAVWLKTFFGNKPVEQKKMVQQITLIAPPPPPPPPPPPEVEEPEPEEEVIQEQIEESLPEESAEEPAGEELGVDAEGAAGGDGFGLVAKKGGRGLLGGGGYGVTIKGEINTALLKDERLSHIAYQAVVTLWVEEDGSVSRYVVELEQGKEKAQQELERFFKGFNGFSAQKPLEEKNTRFRFRISSVI